MQVILSLPNIRNTHYELLGFASEILEAPSPLYQLFIKFESNYFERYLYIQLEPILRNFVFYNQLHELEFCFVLFTDISESEFLGR